MKIFSFNLFTNGEQLPQFNYLNVEKEKEAYKDKQLAKQQLKF